MLQQAFWAALNSSRVKLEDVGILDVTPIRLRGARRGLLQLNVTSSVFAVQLRNVAGGSISFNDAVANFAFTTAFAQQLVALDFTFGTSIQRSTAGGNAVEVAAPIMNIDACKANPCNNGNGTATCTDLPAPAPNSRAGRTCSCSGNFFYQDDTAGCAVGDCVGAWSTWSSCSKACDGGVQTSVYRIVRPAVGNGEPCPSEPGDTREQNCNDRSCRGSLMDVGNWHSCAVQQNGSVVCWGDRRHNKLRVPPGLDNEVIAISAGGFHTCVLTANDSVVCWGMSSYRQLNIPANLSQSGIASITAGGFHTCVLGNAPAGNITCWGDNSNGQLNKPAGLDGQVLSVSAGGYHTCALKTDGTVICWGANWSKQLEVPRGLTDVMSVSAGRFHSCATKSDNTAVCWGSRDIDLVTDVPRSLQTFVDSVASGGYMSCALLTDQSVECFGATNARRFVAVPTGLVDVMTLSVGMFHACALKVDGFTIVCWGDNSWGRQATVPW
eukprot:gene13896-14015_t